jgi:hypothetical protein
MTDCEHKKIIIQAGNSLESQVEMYWGHCIDCHTNLSGELEEYRMTNKKYENNYVIYKKD